VAAAVDKINPNPASCMIYSFCALQLRFSRTHEIPYGVDKCKHSYERRLYELERYSAMGVNSGLGRWNLLSGVARVIAAKKRT